MIKELRGNIFTTKHDYIVNATNCEGFMGKGIALEMSIRYPELEESYKEKCRKHKIKPGILDIYDPGDGSQKILNFPTKDSYKLPSRSEYLEKGLREFARTYKSLGIKSIAFPMLGVQNGGLDREESLSLMKRYLGALEGVEIEIYNFDKGLYEEDLLFSAFRAFLDKNSLDESSENERKNKRIKKYIDSYGHALTFADICTVRISTPQPAGGYKKEALVTKNRLKKIIATIKNSSNTALKDNHASTRGDQLRFDSL